MDKRTLILFLFAGTIGMMFIMSDSGKTLSVPAATPYGILNLEFAYNTLKTQSVVNAWEVHETGEESNITVAKKNTYWDFVFLTFYASFLFFICRQIASSYDGVIHKAGNFCAAAAVIAGLLDVCENTGMLQTLGGHQSSSIAMLTAICAGLKWLLVIIAVIYIITAGTHWGYKKYIDNIN